MHGCVQAFSLHVAQPPTAVFPPVLAPGAQAGLQRAGRGVLCGGAAVVRNTAIIQYEGPGLAGVLRVNPGGSNSGVGYGIKEMGGYI